MNDNECFTDYAVEEKHEKTRTFPKTTWGRNRPYSDNVCELPDGMTFDMGDFS